MLCAAVLLGLVLVGNGVQLGSQYVLSHQPHDERAIVDLTLARLQPTENVLVQVPPEVPLAKYSALAHRSVPWDDGVVSVQLLEDTYANGTRYVLWHDGRALPEVPTLRLTLVEQAGRYRLYQLQQVAGLSRAALLCSACLLPDQSGGTISVLHGRC
ncbi:MAG: hypothetical protein HC837_15840 [Chloroflexaceae bacterium]|nr:hypothetical protein [Chloroflexaceae bacterium]